LQDGGFGKLRERLENPAIRKKMITAMHTNANDWENLYYGSGGPENILLLQFKQDSLKKFTGKTVAEVAKIRGTSPEETAMDLIVQDSTRVGVAYFLMDENNIKKEIVLPWVSFGSDEGSYTPQGIFLKSNAHPRAYGCFARVIGKYTRDEKLLSLQQAIYKLAKLPATHIKLQKRGELKAGNYADVVIFDPATVQDHATYDKPHQYSTGVVDVFVNGVQVLKNDDHTGALPGRFLKGPGYHRVM
jgi:N-acyl-D-amino-acid deacylase